MWPDRVIVVGIGRKNAAQVDLAPYHSGPSTPYGSSRLASRHTASATAEMARDPVGQPFRRERGVQQRANKGTKDGLKRATLGVQKLQEINDLAISGVLATDQKVRSSNLFGRAILSIDPLQAGQRFSEVARCQQARTERAQSLTVPSNGNFR